MSIGNPINTGSKEPYTLAVIGDTPYGPEKLAEFPALTDLINGDPKVSLVTHLGDIKAGSRRSRRMPQTIVIQIGNLAAAFDKPVLLPSISG